MVYFYASWQMDNNINPDESNKSTQYFGFSPPFEDNERIQTIPVCLLK
jgi:hypothetical protein